MHRHFFDEMARLKKRLFEMASMVEANIAKAIGSLVDRNTQFANEVIKKDHEIDKLEIEIDELCLKLLALQQPLAVDLRFITSAMKINNDLERIGDHAVNIAENAIDLNKEEQLKPYIDIPRMAKIAQFMVKDSLDSFIEGDVKKARELCVRDDLVDQLDVQIFRELLTYMLNDPKTISRALQLVLVSKNLERIADLSTNIAEEVIFIYKAETIKHHSLEKKIKQSDHGNENK